MANLGYGLKVETINGGGYSIGNLIPIFGYFRTPKYTGNDIWRAGLSIPVDTIAELMDCDNTVESIFETVNSLSGFKIVSRSEEDIPIVSRIAFEIRDSNNNIIPMSSSLYRPALYYIRGANYIYLNRGCLTNNNGVNTSESVSSGNAIAVYLLNETGSPRLSVAVNCYYAIACIDEEAEEELSNIHRLLIYGVTRRMQDNVSDVIYAQGNQSLEINVFERRFNSFTIPELILPEAEEELTDTTSEPGGYGGKGAHDHTSDTIGIPNAPRVSTSSVGFMHIYNVNSGALSTLGQYLFPSLDNMTDLESVLRGLTTLFAYRDSIQYIVDLHSIPVAPTVGGSAYIKVGALETDISQPTVSSDYVDFDCGSVSIPENFANFIDYVGTRARLFLPFVGFVDVKPEFWNGGTLSVKYRFNVVDGSFMAYVIATSSKSQLSNTVIGQYGGCACIHFPVVANSYGALASGLVSGAAAVASMGSAAVAGDAGKAADSGLSAAQSLQLQPPMSQSNGYNASASYLGVRRPYLLIERVVPSFSAYYNKENGLPLNVTTPLSKISGFTVIENINFLGDTFATAEDLAEIADLMRGGVIL